MTHFSETITALASASGRAGIAVIRVSGEKVKFISAKILSKSISPRVATYLPFFDDKNEIIDMGIAILFENPHSFTGEDILELHCHGGPIVVDLLLQRIINLGARLANPGEFSERAFLNNKIDLAQAEGIADLINANSQQAAKSALRSLTGDFSNAIQKITADIINIRKYLEASIDFSDEEIDFLVHDAMIERLKNIISDLAAIQRKSQQGSLLRDGITVVIAGKPNVGKSSLLNCLSGNDVAIVTDIPGTTRDLIKNQILIDGMPLHIIDTAGLRNSADVVEQEGIRRALEEINQADLILFMVDNSADLHEPVNLANIEIKPESILFIQNKIDLQPSAISETEVINKIVLRISVKDNIGIEELRDAIKKKVGFISDAEGVFLARRRHLDALQRAHQFCSQSLVQLGGALELAAEDLRLAQMALNEIMGEFSSDDLLGEIFSSFCIGK